MASFLDFFRSSPARTIPFRLQVMREVQASMRRPDCKASPFENRKWMPP